MSSYIYQSTVLHSRLVNILSPYLFCTNTYIALRTKRVNLFDSYAKSMKLQYREIFGSIGNSYRWDNISRKEFRSGTMPYFCCVTFICCLWRTDFDIPRVRKMSRGEGIFQELFIFLLIMFIFQYVFKKWLDTIYLLSYYFSPYIFTRGLPFFKQNRQLLYRIFFYDGTCIFIFM